MLLTLDAGCTHTKSTLNTQRGTGIVQPRVQHLEDAVDAVVDVQIGDERASPPAALDGAFVGHIGQLCPCT